ncbi:hypothetical protein [Thioalkalivibrio sp.]|uniref:hypothetical protein n=1 Tax=Thioalkalivibrio sp. TaxID=2093813 RepID=UPI00356697B5
MPTKRTRRTRNRADDMPRWAHRFLETGEVPTGGADRNAYAGWRFFGESVPGLPDEDTREGKALIHGH